MGYGLTVDTAALIEPITRDEAKLFLRVDVKDDDVLIDGLISAARIHAEVVTARTLINTTWDLTLDSFPFIGDSTHGQAIYVPRPPLVSVTSIVYLDQDEASQTWAASDYIVDTKREPGRITPATDETWPTTASRINAVTVKFVGGYGATAATVPKTINSAMKQLIVHLYENRNAVVQIDRGGRIQEVPKTIDMLLGLETADDFRLSLGTQ